MGKLYVGLVHFPITNKNGEKVTTSVTNLDIHDISRSCRTFGVKKFFIITPLEAQHNLVNRILGHWDSNKGLSYNPDRSDAMASTFVSHSVDESIDIIEHDCGERPKLTVTGANFKEHNLKCNEFKNMLKVDKAPHYLLFGTGWGLHADMLDKADFSLDPIFGNSKDGYNHLSVRSAVAIYLDRVRSS